MTDPSSAFPALLYVGDVPVESTVAGAALLYRLLSPWPASRLRIVQTANQGATDCRLKGVEYREIQIPWRRLWRTRLGGWYRRHLFRAVRRGGKQIIRAAGNFHPDAILAVAHGHLWVAAADAANRLGVPLHLIIHDDPVSMSVVNPSAESEVYAVFGDTYRKAASRLCVSPRMAQQFQRDLGVAGDVLYPGRAQDGLVFEAPPERLAEAGRPLTFGYAGSINSAGYVSSLRLLADATKRRGDRLLIYSPMTIASAERLGLTAPHVTIRPVIPFGELMQVLRNEVDARYVPMSFEPVDRTNMELSFPSKLTDYTAIGLPLLIRGPDYCSASQWAKENSGVAVVVNDPSLQAMDAALATFDDPARRMALARAAIRVGREYFSSEAAFAKLVRAISNQTRAGEA